MIPFTDEAERLKFRAFYEFIECGCGYPICMTCFGARRAFDKKFPPADGNAAGGADAKGEE